MKNPQGFEIAPVTVSVVEGSEDKQFLLSFADQQVRGEYRLDIGPEIEDPSGNKMNQDDDPVNGESTEDIYHGTVLYRPVAWSPAGSEPNLYVEDFENWPSIPNRWSFTTTSDVQIQVVTAGDPHGGTHHLEISSSSSSQYATANLAVDLSGQVGRTDLYLNFWARKVSSPGLSIYLSGDGTNWQYVQGVGLNTLYTEYSLDLDQLASDKGIALDRDVYIRFRYSGYSGYKLYLDDVSIITGELDN